MEHQNYFHGGMDLDLSKYITPKDKYLRADNMRLVTQNGQSLYAIENVKGNTLSFSLPNPLPPTYKIQVNSTGNCTISLSYNGVPVAGSSISVIDGTTTGQDLYNSLSSLPAFGSSYVVAYNDDYIIITSSNADFAPTVSSSSLTVTTVVSSQSNLQPIGSCLLRDDIYIYTTAAANNATSPTNTAGQIWKLVYDKVSLSTTLTLIYNNIINFSTYNGIPPTATKGRYENSSIQRLYWTDNFNKLRQLNVADSNASAVDPSVLDVKSAVNFDTPLLTSINNNSGGVLQTGVWQLAYRLYNTGGALTGYSELSDLVPITSFDENDTYEEYMSSTNTSTTAKSITWHIEGLDTNYTRIQFVSIYKSSKTGIPTIELFRDEPIPNSGEVDVTLFGNETTTTITLDEFNSFNSTFDYCKTITDKDNRLFVGNVRSVSGDINFDARAYSYQASQTSTLLTNSGSSALYTGSVLNTSFGIGETHDAVNPNHDLYRYKYNSTELGGTGPNVSYGFGTISTIGDSLMTSGIVDYTAGGLFHPNKNYTRGQINLGGTKTYDTFNCTFDGLKNPYEMFLLRGYQKGEVYRFGLELYDLQGKPMFVKWIADIKIPDQYDTNSNPDTNTAGYPNDFRNSWIAGGQTYCQQTYVKFEVNISSIQSQISGFRIVRLDREYKDKTILGQGILYDTTLENLGASTIYNSTWADALGRTDDYAAAQVGYTLPYIKTFNSPEMLIGGHPPRQTGDVLKVVSRAQASGAFQSPTGSGTSFYRVVRFYGVAPLPTQPDLGLRETVAVVSGNTFTPTLLPAYTFSNNSFEFVTPAQNGVGGTTLYCHLNNTPVAGITTGEKFVCNYYRPNNNQYGGNTYSSRTNNIYIAAGEFIAVNNSSTSTYNLNTFGGDTFVGLFDNGKIFKGGASATQKNFTTICALESTYNVEFRDGSAFGYTANTAGWPAILGNNSNSIESFAYNQTFSTQNDTRKYYPKPLNFTPNQEFDNRIYYSEIKINGELSDNWSNFKTNNYWDVEGSYGPINIIDTLDNQFLYFQDRAFGILMVNPVAEQTTSIGQVIVGTGNTVQKHNYVSTKVGCKHQWGQCKSEHSYFWIDILGKRIHKYSIGTSGGILSDLGMYSYLQNNLTGHILDTDKPTWINTTYNSRNGIIATYDKLRDEAIFTAFDHNHIIHNPIQTSFTLVYTDHNSSLGTMRAFSSFWDQKPYMYINDDLNIFSPNPTSTSTYKDIYIHNKGNYGTFYGTIYSSKLKLLVNPFPKETKVFDNFQIQTEAIDYSGANPINLIGETWKQLRVYDDYQNTDTQTLTVGTNIKREERNWNIAIPRNRVLYTTASPDIFTDLSPTSKTYGERIRDKYITVDLTYPNTNNYSLITQWFNTIFRKSDR